MKIHLQTKMIPLALTTSRGMVLPCFPRIGLDWWFGGSGWFPISQDSGVQIPNHQSKPPIKGNLTVGVRKKNRLQVKPRQTLANDFVELRGGSSESW